MTEQVKQSPPSEETAIRVVVLDYMEGWYEGDVDRVERALHADLAKRAYLPASGGEPQFSHMSALGLLQAMPKVSGEKGKAEVEILDVFEGIASVRAAGTGWVDYIHLVRVGKDWKIINMLWQLAE